MTTRIAIILFLLIVGLIVLDTQVFESGYTLFAIRRLIDLIQYLAIWR